jgi:ribosome-interacting GTPase 1
MRSYKKEELFTGGFPVAGIVLGIARLTVSGVDENTDTGRQVVSIIRNNDLQLFMIFNSIIPNIFLILQYKGN